ncbi:MAG: hypothetical protein KKB21_01405 [Nanoarchaeota archaeon]|nr:hypothetical protein [Nanoarchaeota archaeon]MBU4086213.1 hypothetical protein [Nanoarchaeota archaeon]
MKKVVFMLLFSLLLMSLVLAEQNQVQTQNKVNSAITQQIRTELRDKAQEIKDDIKELRETRKELNGDIKAYLQERKEIRAEIRGINLTFEKGEGEEIKLRIGNFTARTTLNITEEQDENNNTILVVQKGDKTREIKIMPDTAAERALERLKLKVCNETEGCTIELKDVPVKKVERLAYEMQVQRHYKLLGLFRAKAQNKVQIDAENGEIISTKKPWWAFLAKEAD